MKNLGLEFWALSLSTESDWLVHVFFFFKLQAEVLRIAGYS